MKGYGRKMSKRSNRANFRRSTRVHKKNFAARVPRGGFRLD